MGSMQQPQGPGGELTAALAKAEYIMSSAGRARAGHVSVACKPTGEVFQLLSHPELGVPPGLWAALEESEAALPEPHIADSLEVSAPSERCGDEETWHGEDGEEGRVGGKRLAGPLEEFVSVSQRSRLSLDPQSPAGTRSVGAAGGEAAWAQDGVGGAGALEHASQGSAASGVSEEKEGDDGEGEDMQVDSSEGGTQFLSEANPVLVAPSIPPEDPYLLKDASLSAVNPEPLTLHTNPWTLHPKPSTINTTP